MRSSSSPAAISIAAWSARDADRYPRFLESFARISGVLRALSAAPPPSLDDPTAVRVLADRGGAADDLSYYLGGVLLAGAFAVVAIVAMIGSMVLMADRPMGDMGTMKQVDLLGRLLMPLAISLRDWIAGQGWILEQERADLGHPPGHLRKSSVDPAAGAVAFQRRGRRPLRSTH